MKKVEEFQETQRLIDEYNGFESKIPELEEQIKQNENKAEHRKVRLEQEMEITEDDRKLLNEDQIKEITKLYQKQIKEVDENLNKDNNELQKQIEESKDNKKYFRTDEHLKTITMEIEAMKKEVQKGKRELKKKDIELEEFYGEEKHENPLKWQEIYKEKDAIMQDINALTSKIEEYSKFKEDLLSIELTADEYKKLFAREEKQQSTKTVGGRQRRKQ